MGTHRRLLAASLAGLAVACGGPPAAPPPGLVLVSVDTLRADALGSWGNPRGATPHLDRLARRGAQFPLCIAQASSTLPSHRSLFRMRLASRADDDGPVLAELLAAEGHRTAAFTGGGNLSGELGFARGFATWEESADGLGWSVERLGAWLGEGRGPWFAFLHGYDVHLPYDPPPPFDRIYDPHYDGPVRGAITRPLCRAIRGLEVEEDFAVPELEAADRAHLRTLYDGAVRLADARVGALGRLLEERGLLAATTLAIVSDHGEEFFDHGSLLHSHTVYQELVHVPLVLLEPGGGPGLVPGVVSNVDVGPTLLELAGLAPPADADGESLVPGLDGHAPADAPAVSEMKLVKGIVEWPWKLVVDGVAGREELYHLGRDPGERRDVRAELGAIAEGLGLALRALTRGGPVEELSARPVSDALRERLRALGYLE